MPARLLLFALLVFCSLCSSTLAAKEISIASLAELAEAASRSDQTITMRPGVYPLTEFIPLSSIPERRARKEFPFMVFSGSNNRFHLDGVTIELDTALRNALRPPVHTSEFVIAGDQNLVRGLTIRHIGAGTSPGGAAFAIAGRGNTLENCTLHVRGSFPYGYGDLFGKGGPGVIPHRKHSGMLVTGNDTTVRGCKLFMRSFGHGYFVQKDAANVRFEDCYVEGEMRPTDEMLTETTGPAFKVGFRTVAKNRRGENKITPGYMKSLAEDGFRTYGQHQNLVFKNCTAKHMRGGFEVRSKTGVRLENCTAIGNERGFWVGSGATVTGCRGDSAFGPLLFVEGDRASVELELLPSKAAATVHALATIQGAGHQISINSSGSKSGEASVPAPVLIGYGTPAAGEGMATIPERPARDVTLRSETAAPIFISNKASDIAITTAGRVEENKGKEVSLKPL